MSLNVLIIPEDFRKDQYILAPLIQRMFEQMGRPRARVRMCLDPLLGGIDQALQWDRIETVLGMYPMVHVFLLLVDRDGQPGRRTSLDQLEERAEELLGPGRVLFGENAWQEIEVWALAGQDLPGGWNWGAIRDELHPKETYFQPHAEARGLESEPGEGRTTMGRDAAQHYNRVKSRCAEDIAALELRISKWLDGN